MKLPIVAYGDPVLKKQAEDINQEYPQLSNLIENMFDTMYAASGVGLAAPQIGWDGKYQEEQVPQDVYVFYVKYVGCDDKERWFRGTFTLLR